MKKILALLFVLLPLCGGAQILGPRHHLEAGAGVVLPKEVFYSIKNVSEPTGAVYAAYRYNLTDGLSIGAQYSYVIPHGTQYYSQKTDPNKEDFYREYKQQFHTLNAVLEYRLGKSDTMSTYVGGGIGVHYYYALGKRIVGYDNDMSSIFPGVNLSLSFEFFHHLRLSLGHYHDITYHFYPNNPVASYYNLSVGWSF